MILLQEVYDAMFIGQVRVLKMLPNYLLYYKDKTGVDTIDIKLFQQNRQNSTIKGRAN